MTKAKKEETPLIIKQIRFVNPTMLGTSAVVDTIVRPDQRWGEEYPRLKLNRKDQMLEVYFEKADVVNLVPFARIESILYGKPL